MVAVDTNVIVRFLTRDDETQYQQAYALFQHEQVYIPDTVLLETEWVLRYAYKFAPDKIIQAFNLLLGLPNVTVAESDRIAMALEWHKQGMDFADAFHLASSQHCQEICTFDEDFWKHGKDLSPCSVKKSPFKT